MHSCPWLRCFELGKLFPSTFQPSRTNQFQSRTGLEYARLQQDDGNDADTEERSSNIANQIGIEQATDSIEAYHEEVSKFKPPLISRQSRPRSAIFLRRLVGCPSVQSVCIKGGSS